MNVIERLEEFPVEDYIYESQYYDGKNTLYLEVTFYKEPDWREWSRFKQELKKKYDEVRVKEYLEEDTRNLVVRREYNDLIDSMKWLVLGNDLNSDTIKENEDEKIYPIEQYYEDLFDMLDEELEELEEDMWFVVPSLFMLLDEVDKINETLEQLKDKLNKLEQLLDADSSHQHNVNIYHSRSLEQLNNELEELKEKVDIIDRTQDEILEEMYLMRKKYKPTKTIFD